MLMHLCNKARPTFLFLALKCNFYSFLASAASATTVPLVKCSPPPPSRVNGFGATVLTFVFSTLQESFKRGVGIKSEVGLQHRKHNVCVSSYASVWRKTGCAWKRWRKCLVKGGEGGPWLPFSAFKGERWRRSLGIFAPGGVGQFS